jgi:hypothetical protein
MSIAVEQQLLGLAQRLPAERVREVVDFAEFLLARSAQRRRNGSRKGSDALRRYVGGVRHGQLAQSIDEELYGRLVR